VGVFINPGTEPVQRATVENAIINMRQLVEDSGQDGVIFERIEEQDKDGRFSFDLKSEHHDFIINVEMPGCELERVRDSKPFYSPRLYVDGSSWLWGFALSFIDFDAGF